MSMMAIMDSFLMNETGNGSAVGTGNPVVARQIHRQYHRDDIILVRRAKNNLFPSLTKELIARVSSSHQKARSVHLQQYSASVMIRFPRDMLEQGHGRSGDLSDMLKREPVQFFWSHAFTLVARPPASVSASVATGGRPNSLSPAANWKVSG